MSAAYSLSLTSAVRVTQCIHIRKLNMNARVPCAQSISYGPSFRQLANQHKSKRTGTVPASIYRRGREGIVDDVGLPEEEEEEDVVILPPKTKTGRSEESEADAFFDGVNDSRRYTWHEAGGTDSNEADVQHEENGGTRYPNVWLLFLKGLRSGRWRSSSLKGLLRFVVAQGTGVSQTCQHALFASLPPSVPPHLIKISVNGFFLLAVLWMSKLVIDVLVKVGGLMLAAIIVATTARLLSQRARSEEEPEDGSKLEAENERSFNPYDDSEQRRWNSKKWNSKKRKPPDAGDYFERSPLGAA